MLRKRRERQFQEIDEYRDLLHAPDQYEDAFNLKTILGALFVAVIMVPGNMYLGLMIGGGIGAAAEWVTVILFIEIAKRSLTTLRKQEIYLLLYVATALVAAETGSFQGLLWNQYFVQSPEAQQFGISKLIPSWVAPQPESEAIINRTFFHKDWLVPIILLVLGMIMGKIAWFTGGYVLFRLTSDYERLPFPFAPIAAQGAMALAESSSGQETWRWRYFSLGAVIGMAWGLIYVAVPAITGALFGSAITLIPIPWVDLTPYTGYFLPATPLGFTMHLGPIFAGLLAPFWGVVGTFIGVLTGLMANPLLHHYGLLPHWYVGMDTIKTLFVNSIDFWMSFGIGSTLAFTVIGFYQVFTGVHSAGKAKKEKRRMMPPAGRGDFRIWICVTLFALHGLYVIVLAKILFPRLVSPRLIMFFVFFAFVYTPLISFINARLIGMVGQTVSIPYIQEATIFLSGFRGVEIWFVPFPLGNYGDQASKFRVIELTGTKFTSFVKAELFMVPVVLIMSLLYWSYLWKLSPIPSEAYPYAQRMWPLQALNRSVWLTSTIRSEMKETEDKIEWKPSNLTDGAWWYWRARATDDVEVKDYRKRRYGAWSQTGYFYTDFEGKGPLPDRPAPLPKYKGDASLTEVGGGRLPNAPVLVGPVSGERVSDPRPELRILPAGGPESDAVSYYFEVDQVPTFDGTDLQTSEDRPILFEALKPPIIAAGFIFVLGAFSILSFFGFPILLIFGYLRSLNAIPHTMITEIIGALLARFYFWKKYGRQQWRLYAAVLSVGFAVGMALVGMASVAVAMIQKSVSVLIF